MLESFFFIKLQEIFMNIYFEEHLQMTAFVQYFHCVLSLLTTPKTRSRLICVLALCYEKALMLWW